MPAYGSFWCRDIFSLMDIFRGITVNIPRAGDTILLWKDIWTYGNPLQDTLTRLFSFAKNEDISLAQFHNNHALEDNFHLHLSVQAMEEFHVLHGQTEAISLEPLVSDEWITCWGCELQT